jgi:uncharacterized protein GlcG (DUF336 family)
MSRSILRWTARLVSAIAISHAAQAQVQMGAAPLPLSLAIDAAQAAIHACELKGWPVSVSVVDVSGVVRLQVRADHSTIHTDSTAFRKAYTVVTLGPIFGFDASSAFADFVAKSPSGPALASVANVIPLAGGVAIKRGNEIIAALGVGGSPGGDKDEACARAGVGAIADQLKG